MIAFTTHYVLCHEKGNYDILIWKHEEGHFSGAIWYYIQNKKEGPSYLYPWFEFKVQFLFFSWTSEDILEECELWARNNLPGQFSIKKNELAA